MSSVVQHGRIEVQSNTESAEEMVKALTPAKDGEARVIKPIKDRGKDVPEKEAAISTSEAGRRGAEAAAKARADKAKEEAKDAKPDDSDKGKREAAAAQPKKDAEAEDQKEPALRGDRSGPEPDDARDSRTSAQARIRELAQQRAEARKAAEEERAARLQLQERLEALERGRTQPQTQPQPRQQYQARADDPEPDPSSYDDFLQLTRDQAAWAVRQENRRLETERNIRAHREAQAKYYQEQQQTFVGRLEAAREVDPDIDTKIDPQLVELLETTPPGGNPTVRSTIADEIFQAEHPAELLVFYTENPDEMRKLAAARSAREIARAILLMDRRFTREERQDEPEPDKPAVKLPQPLKPVGGSAQPGNVEGELIKDMPFDEYHRKRARWK